MVKFREKVLYLDPQGRFSVSKHRWKREFYLDVLSGRVGVFERRLSLTDEEIRTFEKDAKAMEPLAAQVLAWPERFGSRLKNL